MIRRNNLNSKYSIFLYGRVRSLVSMIPVLQSAYKDGELLEAVEISLEIVVAGVVTLVILVFTAA